ncbi:carboxypeptidase-like regulatory domain-containing protein [Inhella sp.]|uniref:carboxypeptidase-like regulatory domain-containing protein n=1 Tax=Inhella sp. TaxID=1921806 RepID=UPI0035B42625
MFKPCKTLAIALLLTASLPLAAQDVRYRQDKLQTVHPFSMEEASGLMAIGESTLQGQASMTLRKTLLQLRPGTKIYAREQPVYLFPMTKFLRAWVQRHAPNGLRMGMFDLQPELDHVAARTLSDREGRFRFRGLQPGQYLLWAVIPYEVEGWIAQETGEHQITTFSHFGIVTAAVREPVTRSVKQVRELENHVIHVVDIPPGRGVVDLGEIHGERAQLK